MKHLLSIADLDKDEIIGLLDEADTFRDALKDREVKSFQHYAGAPSTPCFMKTPRARVPRLKQQASGCPRMSLTSRHRRLR